MKDLKEFYRFMRDLGWIYLVIGIVCVAFSMGAWALQAWIVKSVLGW